MGSVGRPASGGGSTSAARAAESGGGEGRGEATEERKPPPKRIGATGRLASACRPGRAERHKLPARATWEEAPNSRVRWAMRRRMGRRKRRLRARRAGADLRTAAARRTSRRK